MQLNIREAALVHLSADKNTALKVGGRRGKPVILLIDAGKMYTDGHKFYLSENGVWLTDCVPAEYLQSINFEENEPNPAKLKWNC